MRSKHRINFLFGIILFTAVTAIDVGISIREINFEKESLQNSLISCNNLSTSVFNNNLENSFSQACSESEKNIRLIDSKMGSAVVYSDSFGVAYQSEELSFQYSSLNITESIEEVFLVSNENDGVYYWITFSEDLTGNYLVGTYIIKSSFSGLIIKNAFAGLAAFIFLIAIYYFTQRYFEKKIIQPLDKMVAKQLSHETIMDEFNLTEKIDMLSKNQTTFEEKIIYLSQENEKNQYIINSIPQGLIVVDNKGLILLVNKAGEKIISSSSKKAIGNPLVRFYRKKEVLDLVDKAIEEKVNEYIEYKTTENKYYKLNIYSLNLKTSSEVCLIFNDVTQEKVLSKSKRDFFANASHELKSPLTTIKGYIQLVKEGIITDENEKRKTFERVISEANRMNDIIIQMLDLSKLEVFKPLKGEIISCREIIDEVLSMLNKIIFDKSISTSVVGEDFKFTMMKEDAISLIKNIVENAVLYNNKNGEISIALNDDSIEISDTGIGIPEKYQERIFERFYRVDKAKSRKLGGTGLGLSIVKHICINYNLKLSLKSSLGEGTTIRIDFNNIISK